jgi:acetyl esterase/lipase
VAEDADAQPWLQVDGLRETVAYLHGLVRDEAAVVGGLGNVVLGGISQGCAASLVGGLLFEGEREEERLGGMVGMCGWLPFRRSVRDGRTEGDADVDGLGDEDHSFDPFERAASEVLSDAMTTRPGDSVPDALASSITRLREALEMPRQVSKLRPIASTPIFMGHGTEDEKVPVMLGRDTANRISSTGVRVSWNEYPGLGHWFSSAMLADIVQFLNQNTGWDANST